ncbi:hypothetical protein C8Q77DRAFT_1067597 [Trametes polyzona]|nr:hypothetical protein C8Q77DRAFT_1067597 [Trametes polyzona]
MYHSPSTGSTSSSSSRGLSTPSDAPRSTYYGGDSVAIRSPNTVTPPTAPGSVAYIPSCVPSQYGGNHSVTHGLITPPASPEKAVRRGPDFHPSFDAGGRPIPFDVRTGASRPYSNVPIINHPVNRLSISVGGMFTIEVVARGGQVPLIDDFTNQLAYHARSKARILGNRCMFVGLSLRAVQGGVAYCNLHLQNVA